MYNGRPITAMREQLSNLCSLFTLSMVMSDGRDEWQILELAVTSVGSLTSCRAVAGFLTGEGGELSSDSSTLAYPELTKRLVELDGADGRITGTGAAWAWAYALPAGHVHAGYYVVAADAEPPQSQLLLLRMLAQQTGRALATASLHRREREAAGQLRVLNAQLADVNDRLAASVSDLERRRRVHETLSAVAASGAGEAGISHALHRLTGLGVAVEDPFGNLRAWAGPGRPDPYPRLPARRRIELLADARRSPRPVRDRDRIIAVAQPRDEVLGVLALVDPGHQAGEHELFALEHATVVLSMELAHLRSLAENELRLRRDLMDDLLTGTDDESALSRSQALGHDLRTPHRVLVAHWTGAPTEDAVVRAVEQAVTRVLDTSVLLARRSGRVVLVAPHSNGQSDRNQWGELHREVTKRLRSTTGAIGVGGVCATPSEVPRSYAEAERALRVRLGSSAPAGMTIYDDLGIYRLLVLGEDDHEVKQFVREWLGPLLDYDEASRSDLVTTLWQYFECGGNYDNTARALLIHRSTLRYRLRRIRDLSGHDLGVVDSRLNLHVATRAWQILRGLS
ncbi:helix-turn-helix domain-containing protein [Pseudonocardia sp.]|jgi:sugar diacid utilization regulator|uniref:PucR family transcriptional regulator n=1 Tax=Pseudonocardia sp. TaxID=60912 RepID=UPI0031FD072A